MTRPGSDPYDQVPYTDHAYAESHPDRLAVVAKLAGWEPSPIAHARVLELGCGRGGNLLPMAAGMPGATFTGVDRSKRQIDEARRIARETGLANVTLTEASFEGIDVPAASFDYVVCHGVYSWVPKAIRHALLAAIGRWLAPSGVAYVSFNTLPGWYARLAARDWLRFSVAREGLGETQEAAWATLAWLSRQVSPELGAYRRELAQVGDRLEETEPAYLVHEYLAEEHHPELVGTFLAAASAAGLAYLGDAIPAETAIELLPEEAAARARGLGVAAAQQLVDFVRCTSFRRALLVRTDVARERGWKWSPALDPGALASLFVTSRLRPHADARDHATPTLWDGPGGSVQVPDPAAARALQELARAAPRALAVDAIVQGNAALTRELFDLWLADETGLGLHAFEPVLAISPSARPTACPVARWHASHGGTITNRWHEEVRLPEALVRFVLARLDGTRGVPELVREAAAAHPASPADLEALVRGSLTLLSASALLVD